MDDFHRPIDEFPGYRVSRTGEVQSCWARNGRAVILSDTWRPLRPIRRHWGHLTVNLSRDGKKTSRPIHRLVLEAFVGPSPPGLICCHGNGCPRDNRVENLRWDTYKSNSGDALRHGTRAMGSRCGASKLTERDVIEIRRLRDEGEMIGDLAARFNVTKHNIRAIVSRRSWRHLPDDPDGYDLMGFEDLAWRDPRPGVASC